MKAQAAEWGAPARLIAPSHRRPALLAVVLGGCLLAPARAAEQTVVLSATQDTSIFFGVPGAETRADGAGDHLWLAVTAEGLNRRALVRFDLSGVPAGALVKSVTLRLYESRSRDEHTVAVHRLLASWGEGASYSGGSGTGVPAQPGDATWLHRFFPGTFWSTPGGQFEAEASATQSVGLPNQFYSWSAQTPPSGAPVPRLVQDVQGWLANPASNHGWVLIGYEVGLQNAKRFESRNNAAVATRPNLTVVYLEPGDQSDVPVPPWALLVMGAGMAWAWRRRSARS